MSVILRNSIPEVAESIAHAFHCEAPLTNCEPLAELHKNKCGFLGHDFGMTMQGARKEAKVGF